jgi:hypothetical protein
MNTKGHLLLKPNQWPPFAAECRRAQPCPIDARMRLRLPRPSVKGLPSLLGVPISDSLFISHWDLKNAQLWKRDQHYIFTRWGRVGKSGNA